jgi:hypothetical protein
MASNFTEALQRLANITGLTLLPSNSSATILLNPSTDTLTVDIKNVRLWHVDGPSKAVSVVTAFANMLRNLGINISVETEVEPDRAYEQQMKQSFAELLKSWTSFTQPLQATTITTTAMQTSTATTPSPTQTETLATPIQTTATILVTQTITTTLITTVPTTLTYLTTIPTTIISTITTTVTEYTTAIALGVTLLVIGIAVGYIAKRR